MNIDDKQRPQFHLDYEEVTETPAIVRHLTEIYIT